MTRNLFVTVLLLLAATTAFAEPISEGWWSQTASTAGEAESVAMEVTHVTPHIISLESNNGWVGYAWYDDDLEIYTGFFELLKTEMNSERDEWTGEVFQFTLDYDGLTLTLTAQSSERDFKATFWEK